MRESSIIVVGMGPGNPTYLLPAAREAIEQSSLVVGSARHLRGLDLENKEVLELTFPPEPLFALLEKKEKQDTVILVSGDPSFHSLLEKVIEYFGNKAIRTIPGISCLHYLFAKINQSWRKTDFFSLHARGRSVYDQIISSLSRERKAAFLTDKISTPARVADYLCQAGLGGRIMAAGKNLSYADEEIKILRVEEYVAFSEDWDLWAGIVF